VEVSQQASEAPMLAQSCAPVAPGAIETSQTHPLVSLPAWDGSQQAGLSAHREEASLQWKPQQLTGRSVANSDLVMQSSTREQPRREFVRHEPMQPAEAIMTTELTFSGFGASSDSEQVKPVMCLAHLGARQDSESEDLIFRLLSRAHAMCALQLTTPPSPPQLLTVSRRKQWVLIIWNQTKTIQRIVRLLLRGGRTF
jgi:hypothetical protein